MYLLRGTDVEIVNKLQNAQLSDLKGFTGVRVEITGTDAFEADFKDTQLHIHPTPNDVCSRVFAHALRNGLFTNALEIRISTYVAPYLEHALPDHAARVAKKDSPLYVCFQAAACKYAESAAVVRTMQALARLAAPNVHVAVRHYLCLCAHNANECHQFQPKLWALATRDFYAPVNMNAENAVLHEFVGTADEASRNEIAFTNECHELIPAKNWATIAPHRITIASEFPYNSIAQHTRNWSPEQWRVSRVLLARVDAPETKQPFFRTLVPIQGTIATSIFRDLHCRPVAVNITKKLLQHRAWSECATLCVEGAEMSPNQAFNETFRPRVSRLCIEVTIPSSFNSRSVIAFLQNNSTTIHTLELSYTRSIPESDFVNTVIKALAQTPSVRHLVISGSEPELTTPVVSAIVRTLVHPTLRELTLPISSASARNLGTLFAAPKLPALDHLNLVLDASLRGVGSIEPLFPDPAAHPSVNRLTGVSLVLTDAGQQAGAAVLIRKFAMGLPRLRSLEVHAKYTTPAVDYAIATAVSESAPNLRYLERLILDTPVTPELLTNLLAPYPDVEASARLRTLCVNIHGAKNNGPKVHALLRALSGCQSTLRELRFNGEFLDECDAPDVVSQVLRNMRLNSLDISESKIGADLVLPLVRHGPLNASARAHTHTRTLGDRHARKRSGRCRA